MAKQPPKLSIRLDPALQPSELPHHDSLAALQQPPSDDTSASPPLPPPPPAPAAFAMALLGQARDFLQSSLPGFAAKSSKRSPPSLAPVEVLQRTIVGGSGGGGGESNGDTPPPPASGAAAKEYWVARRSKHGGKKEKGDATWEEFVAGLKENHSEHERDYTPGVKDAVKVCSWSGLDGEGWTGVEMAGKCFCCFFLYLQIQVQLEPNWSQLDYIQLQIWDLSIC
jgi:hypothetical protein